MLPRLAAALALVAAAVLVGSPVHAETPAERAAREIQNARDRANAAAQAMFDQEATIDALELEIAETEQDVADLEGEVATLRQGLADRAVTRFTAGGVSANPLFTDVDQMNTQAAADVYAEIATGDQLVGVDDFTAVIDRLDDLRGDLARQRDQAEQARDTYAVLQERAEAEVVHLQEVEEQRLKDEAVRIALEAERQHQIAEEQRQADLAAAAAAAQQPTTAQPPAAQPVQNPGTAAPSNPDDPAPDDPAPAPTPAPTTAPAPPPTAPPVAISSGIVCPLQGSYSFANTWGAARSGGRRHQGVDMISPTGTPIVAVKSGSVAFKVNRLGGNSAWVTANDGDRYYYAHMSSWEGGNRSVSRGDVIGYVGSTGNAGTPHLHFEVHPGGGVAVNPYPYVRAVC